MKIKFMFEVIKYWCAFANSHRIDHYLIFINQPCSANWVDDVSAAQPPSYPCSLAFSFARSLQQYFLLITLVFLPFRFFSTSRKKQVSPPYSFPQNHGETLSGHGVGQETAIIS